MTGLNYRNQDINTGCPKTKAAGVFLFYILYLLTYFFDLVLKL